MEKVSPESYDSEMDERRHSPLIASAWKEF
jgi:hypothetical protein